MIDDGWGSSRLTTAAALDARGKFPATNCDYWPLGFGCCSVARFLFIAALEWFQVARRSPIRSCRGRPWDNATNAWPASPDAHSPLCHGLLHP
jgi:hypothetical protein